MRTEICHPDDVHLASGDANAPGGSEAHCAESFFKLALEAFQNVESNLRKICALIGSSAGPVVSHLQLHSGLSGLVFIHLQG